MTPAVKDSTLHFVLFSMKTLPKAKANDRRG